MQDLKKLGSEARGEIGKVQELENLRRLEIEYLGRKGRLTAYLRSLKDVPLEKRKALGKEANELKRSLEELFSERRSALKEKENKEKLSQEKIDITLPGKRIPPGHSHPATLVEREIEAIFERMGFAIVEGPEIELEWYNFDSLNVPPLHPAREMQDTLWLKEKPIAIKKAGRSILTRLLMRTQVTSIQVRFMEKNNPPLAIIMPGNVYRHEATDASHEMQFGQMDGLVVRKDASLSNLKWIMETVMKKLFGPGIRTRLRPSYFPFTEPSVELDMECLVCRGRGCPACKHSGWIEVLPGGVVHPKVFEAAGYNPRDWQGIAWDIGIDRIAMMKYKIPDIRLFHSQDLRFIKQF